MDFSGVPQEGMVPPGAMVAPPAQMPEDGTVPEDTSLVPGQNGLVEHYEEEIYQQQGEFVEVKNFMVDGGDRFGVSATAFDGQEELLWMGNQGGHVTSYHSLDLHKYTSFQMHETNEVRQMLTIDHNIFSLTSDSLRCWSKFGRPQFTYMSSATQDMQCMLVTGPGSILLGGHQPLVVELDIESHTEIRQVQVAEPGCAIFRYSNQYICTGDTGGKVTLRDPKSLRAEHIFQAHSGTLSDFDVHANQLITCGFVKRMGNLTCDRFLMVYDLRLLRPMTPMQVLIDPLFLRFVPTYSNRICVVSQTGQFQVLEQGVMTPESLMTYQAQTEGAHITSFDMSPSNQVMAFGDAGGFLHVFASSQDAVFSPYSNETEFPTVETVTPVSMMDELTPYAIIPTQYPQTGTLLSDWPEKLCQSVYRKPTRLDPEILKSVKMVQNVGYAPNPNTRLRNQVAYKCNNLGNNSTQERTSSVPESPLGRGEDPFVSVPKRYRKVEIKYSKLGVEDFDFRHYNKTNFAGLETHIPNAYCNSMLQVLYFIEPLRCALLGHICDKEFCLSCELSFLFHMLDSQKGKTCQASNFLRAFRTIPEASALGLVLGDAEESMGKANLPRLIQNWSRFIVQQIHA
ncbi:PAN2-PAN3 deadenylation complex catalytic subunit PAN2, partial [Lamellibrachia satsuma]